MSDAVLVLTRTEADRSFLHGVITDRRDNVTCYRVFPLDDAGHIAAPPIVLTCPSDRSALAVAPDGLAPGQAGEVWQGERLVGRVEHTPDPHAAVDGHRL